jgi:tetratricopeptide (TPR) repeat protein
MSITLLIVSITTCEAQTSIRQSVLESSFSKASQKKDYKSAMGYAVQLGEYFIAAKKYDKAVTWYSRASNIAIQIKNLSGQFDATRGLGVTYLYQKNYSKAIEAFEKSIVVAQTEKSKVHEATGLMNLALD